MVDVRDGQTGKSKSLGGNDVRLITITDGIRLGINYYDMLKLNLKKEVRDRY